MSRNREIGFNTHEQYHEVFEERGVRKIKQFRTPTLYKISQDIMCVDHIWKQGDTFWRLSHKHYGDKSLWYIIAHYNFKPTDAHVKIGDLIKIPISHRSALQGLEG